MLCHDSGQIEYVLATIALLHSRDNPLCIVCMYVFLYAGVLLSLLLAAKQIALRAPWTFSFNIQKMYVLTLISECVCVCVCPSFQYILHVDVSCGSFQMISWNLWVTDWVFSGCSVVWCGFQSRLRPCACMGFLRVCQCSPTVQKTFVLG